MTCRARRLTFPAQQPPAPPEPIRVRTDAVVLLWPRRRARSADVPLPPDPLPACLRPDFRGYDTAPPRHRLDIASALPFARRCLPAFAILGALAAAALTVQPETPQRRAERITAPACASARAAGVALAAFLVEHDGRVSEVVCQ